MTRRRAVIAGVLVMLLALVATWRAFHGARVAREADVLALCNGALGREQSAIDEAFTRAGLSSMRVNAVTSYTRESSYFQSITCLVEIDASGHVRRASITRFRRQEIWQPGAGLPIWGSAIWPAIVRASLPLTP